MFVHHMTLVYFRMLRKNLRKLAKIFGKMVYPPPGKKLPERL